MARDDDRVEPMMPLHAGRGGSDTPITDQFIYLLRHRPRVLPYLARVLRGPAEAAPSSSPVSAGQQEPPEARPTASGNPTRPR